MANVAMWTVKVPDHADVFLPKSLTLDEIRATLSQQGYTSVETAPADVNQAQSLVVFKRPTGGVKGL